MHRRHAVGLVLRRLFPPGLDLRRVLRGRIVRWVLVRAHRDRAEFPRLVDARGRPVTLGVACALAFLAALPQLCSP